MKFRFRICFFSFVLFPLLWTNNLIAQVAADSSAKNDSIINSSLPPDAAKKTLTDPTKSSNSQSNSIVSLIFIKDKIEHSPDSTYFNILKVTNNNGSAVQGVVRISVPQGWKLISNGETEVNISPGNTEYIPIRVSMDRKAIGGTSYVINATLTSDRSLFAGKNQTSISKACYVTIPQKRQWDVNAVQRTMYFDRYSEYTPLKLKLSNKGNGIEVVKLEFEIGSSLQMYGALGNRHFTSVELKPHHDTVVSFPVKYIPYDESELWNRDFKKLTVRVTATIDTIIKRTSVNFKYLESSYYNILADKLTPLTIELGLQNILSDATPSMLIAAYGRLLFKNDDILDYNVRFYSIPFAQYGNSVDAANYFWQRSRMLAIYKSAKWEARVGDINAYSTGVFGVMGRGVGGQYNINDNNLVGGAFTAALGTPIYSGTIFHQIMLPHKAISIRSALNAVADNYNRLNSYGASVQINYPFLPGHSLTLLLAPAINQHNYTNQTFFDASGNPIKTNDPGVTRLGFAGQLSYSVSHKKLSAGLNVLMATKDYYQYYGGKLNLNGNAQYLLNKKYFLIGTSGIYLQDSHLYNRGVLYPQNKFLSGMHRVEIADRVTNKITLYTGPVLEHTSYSALKINGLTGDSTYTHFNTVSPKLSLRCSYKNNVSGFITPYTMVGYTFITSAQDSTIKFATPIVPKKYFFNAKAGLNVIQKNWGVNIFYYIGPQDYSTQSDYYYFGSYNKSLRIMPFFQKYYFNKKMLLSSYDSYFYEVLSNNERIALNARIQFFLGNEWSFYVDNNLYFSSLISSEGQKVYSRNYYLSVGIKKSFDIPQPRVKYYNLKVVCFKDINGNQKMDDNEQGLSDIVITIDKQAKSDSATQKSIHDPGQFAPAEMVTDNFGHVAYYHIPEGEVNLNVYPLQNLKDVFILNGQKQKLTITHDTTFYVPFAQSYRVVGRVILNRDEYSSAGVITAANIRITATDSAGNSFAVLTSSDGSYILYVPKAGEYKVSVNNIYGDRFALQEPEFTVSFNGAKEFLIDFIFNEKKRLMNIANANQPSSQPVNSLPAPASNLTSNPTSSVNIKDTSSSVKASPSNEGVTYRVQIASSSTKLSQAQRTKMFKGVGKVQDYTEGGVYKYTTGDFKTVEEALKFKETLRSKGYKDAFIVPFKNNQRVSNSSTASPNPSNTTGAATDTSNSGISYRVQVASHSSKLSAAQQTKLFKGAENIKEFVQDGVYKYTAGYFIDYAKATEYKNKLIAQGFKGVFVVSFKDNKRIK